jgi:hypothetical protein
VLTRDPQLVVVGVRPGGISVLLQPKGGGVWPIFHPTSASTHVWALEVC